MLCRATFLEQVFAFEIHKMNGISQKTFHKKQNDIQGAMVMEL